LPLDLLLLLRVDEDRCIERRSGIRVPAVLAPVEEERDVYHDQWSARRLGVGHAIGDGGDDLGMDDLFQSSTGRSITEDDCAKRVAIEFALRVDEAGPERLCDLIEHGGSGRLQLVDDRIRVDHGCPERTEEAHDGALSRPDPSGKPEYRCHGA